MEPDVKEHEEEMKKHGHHHDDDCDCKHEHHGPEHGRGHGPDMPPHLMREILDMKEKIGKLEGMMEVLLKK